MESPGGKRRRSAAALLALLALTVGVTSVGGSFAAAQSIEPPPPTPVPVPGGGMSPSPFPTALATPPASTHAPELRAGSAVLADLDTGQVLFQKDGGARRPIASLTKIMTALLVLERTDPSDVVTVAPDAAAPRPTVGVSDLGLLPGEQIPVGQLMYAMLLQSANDAAVALADHVSGSTEAFVSAMNARARRLGLSGTRFTSPNGLDDTGYSTALDLVRITRAAFAHALFDKVVRTKFQEIPSPTGKPRIVQNRNALLWLYPGAIGVKTGFTTAAGYCVVAAAERNGMRLLAVVLGAPGEPFSDAAALLDYGFTAFERQQLLSQGRVLGSVPVQGREVQVAAGASLEGLVPTDAKVRRRMSVYPGVLFPPATGERIGTVIVSTPELSLGRVPLVVAGVPEPPPPGPGPWWRRAASAAFHAVASVLGALFR